MAYRSWVPRIRRSQFDVRQVNCSVSSAGVLRGLHFAQLPPSQAKYVTCVSGSVFDVVVDIREGSPTFGRWDSVLLDDQDRRTIYVSEGLAHGFLALQDNSTVMYLCSAEYNPQREHTICATDPTLAVDWPLVDGAAPACPTVMPLRPASRMCARLACCPGGNRRSGSLGRCAAPSSVIPCVALASAVTARRLLSVAPRRIWGMGSGSRERIVEVFDALDAELDRLDEVSLRC